MLRHTASILLFFITALPSFGRFGSFHQPNNVNFWDSQESRLECLNFESTDFQGTQFTGHAYKKVTCDSIYSMGGSKWVQNDTALRIEFGDTVFIEFPLNRLPGYTFDNRIVTVNDQFWGQQDTFVFNCTIDSVGSKMVNGRADNALYYSIRADSGSPWISGMQELIVTKNHGLYAMPDFSLYYYYSCSYQSAMQKKSIHYLWS